MTDEFDIDGGLFMDVRRATGPQWVRIQLAGVLIEPHPDEGAYLVATDGRVMLVAHDKSAVAPRPAIVMLDLTEQADEPEMDEWDDPLSKADFDVTRLSFALDKGAPCVANFRTSWCSYWRRGVIEEVLPASTFPDWRKVFGGGGQVKRHPAGKYDDIALDPCLLHRISGGRAFQMTAPEEDGAPFRPHFDDRPDLAGLIMPRWAKITAPAFEAEIIEAQQAEAGK